ncbi:MULTISPECIES: DUF6747 family protein [unclassified Arenibacter]|uniref:DUF6747 family protein n=1 Tax=unclassified Arenibacter TaxID=2615047 RepID=UPI000D76B169|nr:DUF6747 family protein [Arenibacter sp. ARW7G5Y1]|tara:strand:- start:14585 stop:14881 length:297 start_codon:yes stop_codon:yes gene_type:complete
MVQSTFTTFKRPFTTKKSDEIPNHKILSYIYLITNHLTKPNIMKNVLLIREIYLEAFRNLGHAFIKSFFKVMSWFCFASFLIVLYAFIFRITTGFAFD